MLDLWVINNLVRRKPKHTLVIVHSVSFFQVPNFFQTLNLSFFIRHSFLRQLLWLRAMESFRSWVSFAKKPCFTFEVYLCCVISNVNFIIFYILSQLFLTATMAELILATVLIILMLSRRSAHACPKLCSCESNNVDIVCNGTFTDWSFDLKGEQKWLQTQ